jgi:hypothetical protein
MTALSRTSRRITAALEKQVTRKVPILFSQFTEGLSVATRRDNPNRVRKLLTSEAQEL